MNIKTRQLILTAIAFGAFLITLFQPVAMASPAEYPDHNQIRAEKMQQYIRAKLDTLEERLEIKSSQQTSWESFANSVEALGEHTVTKPDDDADAATIARYRADRAIELAKKLTLIADTTANLQKVLTEGQRKVFNLVAHHLLNRHHGCYKKHSGHGDRDHE